MSAPLTMILLNIKSRASSQRQKRWWLWVAPLRVESLHRWKDAGFETVTSELFHPDPFLNIHHTQPFIIWPHKRFLVLFNIRERWLWDSIKTTTITNKNIQYGDFYSTVATKANFWLIRFYSICLLVFFFHQKNGFISHPSFRTATF